MDDLFRTKKQEEAFWCVVTCGVGIAITLILAYIINRFTGT